MKKQFGFCPNSENFEILEPNLVQNQDCQFCQNLLFLSGQIGCICTQRCRVDCGYKGILLGVCIWLQQPHSASIANYLISNFLLHMFTWQGPSSRFCISQRVVAPPSSCHQVPSSIRWRQVPGTGTACGRATPSTSSNNPAPQLGLLCCHNDTNEYRHTRK